MLKYADNSKTLEIKKAQWIVNRYWKFKKVLVYGVIVDMVRFDLLEKVNRYKVRIINEDKSSHIDQGVFIKIIESGEQSKNEE